MDTRGNRIRHVRELLGLSQNAFANLLSSASKKQTITRGAVGNWERNQGIKTENLILISESTGADIKWLATGAGLGPGQISKAPLYGDLKEEDSVFLDQCYEAEQYKSLILQQELREKYIEDVITLLEKLDESEIYRIKNAIIALFPDKHRP